MGKLALNIAETKLVVYVSVEKIATQATEGKARIRFKNSTNLPLIPYVATVDNTVYSILKYAITKD